MGIKHTVLFWAILAVSPIVATAADVPTVAVQRAGTGGAMDIEGSIQPVRQATVAAQVSGSVLQLAVKAGDYVKAGQLIARIDDREAAAGVLRTDAAIAQAQAEATNAKVSAERTRDLRSKGFVSQAALDVAETQYKAAQAGVAQAQAARSQAALARGFASVTAPFDGVVQATHLDTGDLATPGRPIATIYAPGALRAVVQIGASLADSARAATKVLVTLPNGQTLTPERRTELATADPVSQTIEWRLDLPATAMTGVMPGQMVRVRFEGAAPKAGSAETAPIRVPTPAVLRRGELNAVYAVQGEHFVLRAVRLGVDRGADGIEVLAGLKPGERVAADALKAGMADARPAK